MAKLSDFSKQQIQDCYSEMLEFVQGFSELDDVDEEDNCPKFDKMCLEIEKREVSIPEDIYKKIDDFLKTKIVTMVNGDDIDKLAEKNTGDEEENNANYLKYRFERERELKKFGKEELYPFLIE